MWGWAVALVLSCAGVASAGPAKIEVAARPDGSPFEPIARRIFGADQGVYAVAESGQILVARHESRAVHPASVSKVATSALLLDRLGPDHRFDTRIRAAGSFERGSLAGDLVIQGGRDAYFVAENAAMVHAALRALGLREVQGRIRVEGDRPFYLNWKTRGTGEAFRRLVSKSPGPKVWSQVHDVHGGLPAARPDGIRVRGRKLTSDADRLWLTHRSAPLRRILKEFNGYSNNVIHALADEVGGAPAVEHWLRDRVPVELRDEIVIDNGAGLGKTNRLSPRAAVEVVRLLRREAAERGLSLVDLLPVAGVDPGTLERRLAKAPYQGVVVGKTGTYPSLGISAIAGVARTQRWGEVTFAILNTGLNVLEARKRQDDFLRVLLDEGGARRWDHEKAAVPAFGEAVVIRASSGRSGAAPDVPSAPVGRSSGVSARGNG